MKSIRNIAFSALLTIGAFTAVTFTSCNPDECKDVICQNGGTCVDGDCSCPTGYEGTLCEALSSTKFVKVWNASDVIGSTTLTYTCAINLGTNVTSMIIAHQFSDDFFITNISATVSGNTITIPDQRPDGNLSDYRVSGTGSYSGGRINWSYTITKVSTGSAQNYTGVWQ